MKFAFRADASAQIGSGHIMRCLTLAEALSSMGEQCTFICREHEGNLIDYIHSKGHSVHSLPIGSATETGLAHSAWLGATQEQDAQYCAPILARLQPDWLVTDHYAIDATWESKVASECGRVMVIDDLSDRHHSCNLLLDQTFGRNKDDYRSLVPEACTVLCGSDYALLRPEFSDLRPYSLHRRIRPDLKHLLVAMGGVDKDNVTSKVLSALRSCPLPENCQITVVLGVTAPWKETILEQAQAMPWPTAVRVGVSNMSQLMADSDLAIGAAGGTSWERCCLGLPCILVTLAANQTEIATQLLAAGAVAQLEVSELQQTLKLMPALRGDQCVLAAMASAASQICTGEGTAHITRELMTDTHENHSTL